MRRASPWWWLVAGSGLVLLGAAVAMGLWWAASSQTRITTYRVVGTLASIELDVEDADVEVVGGDGAVEVRRRDVFAFGQAPRERRSVTAGVLSLATRCAETVVGRCGSDYRIAVPDNVQVTVQTTGGAVRVSGLNASARIVTGSGAVDVDGFCGFSLSAASESGPVDATAACSPDRMELRSGSGAVHAAVPPGRYRVDAHSDRGTARVRGLIVADDASFGIQAISTRGDVLVERTP
jgi:hypothetical protein